MPISIEKKIISVVELKDGNRELTVYFNPDPDEPKDRWTLMLGEVAGEIVVRNESLVGAISDLQNRLHGEGIRNAC